MIDAIKKIYNITEVKTEPEVFEVKHIDGRSRYTALQIVESIKEYERTGSCGAVERLTGVTRNTLKDWVARYSNKTTSEIVMPTARLGKNRIHAAERRRELLSFVSAKPLTTDSLVGFLNVTSNTVRNDIRVLLKNGSLVNVSECHKSYLVKAA